VNYRSQVSWQLQAGQVSTTEFGVLTAVVMEIKTDVSDEHQSSSSYLLHAGFLFGLFFGPENEGDIFF
jgi:hypothetical protein